MIWCSFIVLLLASWGSARQETDFCSKPFDGFGVFLGSINHFQNVPEEVVKDVVDLLYDDLGLRLYRISYEPEFSLAPDTYEISCSNGKLCSYDRLMREIAKYKDTVSVFASLWIAPYYMMNMRRYELPVENEMKYYYYIKNITEIIKTQYGIEIEKVSPINEPENVVAPWDHTNMLPEQLCQMVHKFNDPVVSLCPENSYFWVSTLYKDIKLSDGKTCGDICSIHTTHAYAPTLDSSDPNFPLAYYDLTEYTERGTEKDIWQTEVSSTWADAHLNQMKEAIDMSINIIQLVGTTCIQRYYFWYAFTNGYSGESLIWGNAQGNLTLPKKYYAYKHLSQASSGLPKPMHAKRCDHWATSEGILCLSIADRNAVFVNPLDATNAFVEMFGSQCSRLCCTTNTHDDACEAYGNVLPSRSVCLCENIVPIVVRQTGLASTLSTCLSLVLLLPLFTIFTSRL